MKNSTLLIRRPVNRVAGLSRQLLVSGVMALLLCWSLPQSVRAAAGDLDPTFNLNGRVTADFVDIPGLFSSEGATDVVVQPDGKIIAVGESDVPDSGFFGVFAIVGNLLQFNSITGDYQFTRCGSGIVLSGKGTVTKRGSLVTLQDATASRKVLATVDGSTKRATASIQVFSLGTTFTITDRNTTNDTCGCP